jgi:hypothetical protein
MFEEFSEGQSASFLKPSLEALQHRQEVFNRYRQFDYAPDSYYAINHRASVASYKTREVSDSSGNLWDVVEVNGYMTLPRENHRPVGLMKIGACIPIVVEWTNDKTGISYITVMHQAGNRSVSEIDENKFEPLDAFVQSLGNEDISVTNCRTFDTDTNPSSNPEEMLKKLHNALISRLPGCKEIAQNPTIPIKALPYDLQLIGNEISFFSRFNKEVMGSVKV